MALKALKNRVVVKPVDGTSQTEGGLWIPDSSSRPHSKGEVVSVGNEVKDIQVGDVIIFATFAGMPVQDGSTEYVTVAYEQILVMVE